MHRSKVSLISGQDRLHRNRLIEAIKKALQLRSELEPNGGTGAVQICMTPAKTEQLRRWESDIACSIFNVQ